MSCPRKLLGKRGGRGEGGGPDEFIFLDKWYTFHAHLQHFIKHMARSSSFERKISEVNFDFDYILKAEQWRDILNIFIKRSSKKQHTQNRKTSERLEYRKSVTTPPMSAF